MNTGGGLGNRTGDKGGHLGLNGFWRPLVRCPDSSWTYSFSCCWLLLRLWDPGHMSFFGDTLQAPLSASRVFPRSSLLSLHPVYSCSIALRLLLTQVFTGFWLVSLYWSMSPTASASRSQYPEQCHTWSALGYYLLNERMIKEACSTSGSQEADAEMKLGHKMLIREVGR
jgi:hypothetical protein